ncbi:MAG TPA: amidase family protein [Myxococcales bacterium]|nr:amidase family protein [Myxococcales bacterium]
MKRIPILVAALAATSALAQTAPTNLNEKTVAQLQAMMAAGQLTSAQLTQYYIDRIIALDQNGPRLNSVITINPDALTIARQMDTLRKQGKVLGPLHGIPVLLKDNIDTGDKEQTTAGSFALVGSPAVRDATVTANLRAGGAVILGKTNLSEWANFRSAFQSISGWSAVGGQTGNAYGINRNPCGSSSGSGAAVSANLAAVALATETDGSIVCPANAEGIAAIKPTVGLTSRAGVVPISHTQDTIGSHGRTVADAAAVLGVIQSRTFDGRDPATGGVPLGATGQKRPKNIPTDYTKFLDPNGLKGARLGLTRQGIDQISPSSINDAWEAAVAQVQAAGATVVDLDAANFSFPFSQGELLVLCFDFRTDLKNYFATRTGVPLAGGTLTDAIAFNNRPDIAPLELTFEDQVLWEICNDMAPGADDPQNDAFGVFGGETYNQALADGRNLAVNGIDLALAQFHLDAIIAPTGSPAWSTDLLFGDHFTLGSSNLAAPEGYPIVQVPAGTVLGLPFGISFFGSAFSEPTLIKLASGFEAVTQVRAHNLPTLAPDFPVADGTTVVAPKAAARNSTVNASSHVKSAKAIKKHSM